MKKKAAVFGCMMLFVFSLVACNEKKPDVIMSAPAAAGIEGTKWLLTEVSSAPVSLMAGEKQPHILLDPAQKKASGFAGCNNFFAGYEIDGAALKFGPAGSTRMACPDLETGLETEFLKALDKTRGWEIRNNVLLFIDGSDVLARFAKEDITGEITGTAWHWLRTQYNDDTNAAPADPENYTVQFKEDGTLNVKADCNQKGGAYCFSATDKRLSIELTLSTMAFCPEGSLEDEFVRGLSAATIYFIKDGDLYIDLKYDTGTMRFSEQKEK
jgi:heat shock protein HslJ